MGAIYIPSAQPIRFNLQQDQKLAKGLIAFRTQLLFYGLIDEALYLPEDKGAEVNAAQHVCGYTSKEASSTRG